MISIHALLAESDRMEPSSIRMRKRFLSTLSLRRATTSRLHKILADWDFYPRSPCGERQSPLSLDPINIHNFYPRSPCGERPSDTQHVRRPSGYVYPRSPCGERLRCIVECLLIEIFLSTLSLRRATTGTTATSKATNISIHALLAESDHNGY